MQSLVHPITASRIDATTPRPCPSGCYCSVDGLNRFAAVRRDGIPAITILPLLVRGDQFFDSVSQSSDNLSENFHRRLSWEHYEIE